MKKKRLPAALAVLTIVSGCAPPPCEPVPVPDASVITYACADGRTCSDVRPGNEVYQVCPGTNGCATLVAVDGTSMSGYC